jgi:hypothetical protein
MRNRRTLVYTSTEYAVKLRWKCLGIINLLERISWWTRWFVQLLSSSPLLESIWGNIVESLLWWLSYSYLLSKFFTVKWCYHDSKQNSHQACIDIMSWLRYAAISWKNPRRKNVSKIATKSNAFLCTFFFFLWLQAWSLNPLPEVFLLYMGRAAGFEPELLSFASGTDTLPMSYARPLCTLK